MVFLRFINSSTNRSTFNWKAWKKTKQSAAVFIISFLWIYEFLIWRRRHCEDGKFLIGMRKVVIAVETTSGLGKIRPWPQLRMSISSAIHILKIPHNFFRFVILFYRERCERVWKYSQVLCWNSHRFEPWCSRSDHHCCAGNSSARWN